MEPRLAMTLIGVGNDGSEYSVLAYTKMVPEGAAWVEEAGPPSILHTSEGDEVHRRSEEPPVFWVTRTGVEITCCRQC
jgi:hypothetical protein